ncbi:MAG: ROK family protein [Rhodothermales bacterium]|nr:ROK family protein [Rhodothermales bacterium]
MHFLGIDVGGTGIKAGLVDLEHGRLASDRVRLDTPRPPTLSAVTETILTIVQEVDADAEQIGVAFPARIKRGIVTTATNIDPAFIGTNLASLLSSMTGADVHVLNDADAAGLAEMTMGAGQGRSGVVITITVGTGLGTAVFVDRKLLPGTELGHIRIKGKPAEDYAADSVRKEKDLSWKDWAGRFQRYLDQIEFLFAPDLIILGGGISKDSKKVEYFEYLSTSADLATATLGNNAGIVGAAAAARDNL